jgi:hypothetical protein
MAGEVVDFIPCRGWRNAGKKFTKMGGVYKKPVIRAVWYIPPYMGGIRKSIFAQKSEFSPVSAVYPQFSTGYPQLCMSIVAW